MLFYKIIKPFNKIVCDILKFGKIEKLVYNWKYIYFYRCEKL